MEKTMINENTLETFRQKASEMVAEIERKQAVLKEKLSQRSAITPQPGDIFVFKNPETLGIQWVVLQADAHNPRCVVIVPADDTPMVGSTDVELPKSALCSPLALRCGYSLSIEKDKFDMNLRVGILEERHQQRALDKLKQISEHNVRSTVLQQETDDELDYAKRMEQIYQAQQALATQLPDSVPSRHQESWIGMIVHELKKLRTNLAVYPVSNGKWAWVTGVAMAVVILLISWLVFSPSLTIEPPTNQLTIEQQIDNTYQTYSISAQNSPEIQQALSDTQKSISRSFSPSSQTPTQARQAFDAGFQAGKQALRSSFTATSTETNWQPSEWVDFFELGRWTLLLETMSIAAYRFQYEVPNTFWAEQKQIFATLQAKFNGFKAQQDSHQEAIEWVIVSFQEIEPRLPNETEPARYDELIRELQDMREDLP